MERAIVIFHALMLVVASLSGVTAADDCVDVGGWLSSGMYSNAWGSADNGPVGMKIIGDGYTVQQLWGYAEKPVDTDGGGWDLGGRVDYLFGTDAPFFQAFGDGSWDAEWDTSDDYGAAMPQLYAEVGAGDFSVKGGRFATLIGWEYLEDPPNFFSSNSYSYFFAEPATHTGVLGTWEPNDSVTFHAGWTNGWDAGFTDNGGASTFLGGVTWSRCEHLSVTYACSAGTLSERGR